MKTLEKFGGEYFLGGEHRSQKPGGGNREGRGTDSNGKGGGGIVAPLYAKENGPVGS